ncbi:GTP pyrophosphokinase [Deinococcus maricopensis]|uniref:RelA/SpoT domain protein n=1 Tax=Deinococcus maricopensis (strain DSM 21211 / LMG 22137 / NRRL B-23946 / LB-34) TaxID=709986 RepID=E8U944_DEIML|nr:GTP pyrophosphokinase [Deinococcus maricopensis]ADV67583.1 RelA/SpoT domain protein [Deinococcus maricopensis DSM 21211]
MTSRVLEAYHAVRPRFERLRDVAVADIEAQLRQAGLNIHHVTGRLKRPDSLLDKLRRKPGRYRTLADVTDIVGVRVITYFERDVWQVSRLLESTFDVDWDHSADKSKLLDPDRFGYMGVHYVLRFGARGETMLGPMSGAHFEVQIRSILQHAWAEIEHDLGYKSAGAVPREIRRRFSRLAGLLEVADEEFMAIDRLVRDYAAQLPDRIAQEPDDVFIDAASMSYLLPRADIRTHDERLAAGLGVPLLTNVLDEERPQRLAEVLQLVGVHSAGQLLKELRRTSPQVEAFGLRLLPQVPDTWADVGGLRPGVSVVCYALWRACANPAVDASALVDHLDLRGEVGGAERLVHLAREAYAAE